jgi:hypothetical protein
MVSSAPALSVAGVCTVTVVSKESVQLVSLTTTLKVVVLLKTVVVKVG